MYEAINQGDKDFSALVSKMKQANIDAIYFGGYQTEAGLIVRQARDQGLKAPLIGGDALGHRGVLEDHRAGRRGHADDLRARTRARSRRPRRSSIVFRAQGYNPEGYTLYTYAAVQAFKAAAEKAKSIKLDDLSKALKSTEGRHRDRHA